MKARNLEHFLLSKKLARFLKVVQSHEGISESELTILHSPGEPQRSRRLPSDHRRILTGFNKPHRRISITTPSHAILQTDAMTGKTCGQLRNFGRLSTAHSNKPIRQGCSRWFSDSQPEE